MEAHLKQHRPPRDTKTKGGKGNSETGKTGAGNGEPRKPSHGHQPGRDSRFGKASARFSERETARNDNPWQNRESKAKEQSGPDQRGLEGPRHGRLMLYGLHAVRAALDNPKRRAHRLYVTTNARERLGTLPEKPGFEVIEVRPDALDRLLGADAVHQGVALEVEPLAGVDLDDLAPEGIVLVLDQITDPHNVGAILRSAAAFNVKALVVTERHSPHMTGVLAKTASGGLEHVPIITVVNLAQALAKLGEIGFWRIGLDSEGPSSLTHSGLTPPLALVLGAEGKGLRRLTRERCDDLARLDMPGAIKSLNVSNAAAICLALLAQPRPA